MQSGDDDAPDPARVQRLRTTVQLLTVIEVILLSVIVFGDFGFYFPGRMGDWSDLMNWVFFYSFLCLCGAFLSATVRQFRLLTVQLPLLSLPLLYTLALMS